MYSVPSPGSSGTHLSKPCDHDEDLNTGGQVLIAAAFVLSVSCMDYFGVTLSGRAS